MRGSLLTMLFIARIYGELRMPLAAKKYALSAAFAACTLPDRGVQDLAPAGLFLAASYDYLGGAWVSALRMIRARSYSTVGMQQTPGTWIGNKTLRQRPPTPC